MNTTQIYTPNYEVRFLTPSGAIKAFAEDVVSIETLATAKEMVNQWRVVLVPRDPNKMDLYDVLEPMAYCEIALRRINKEMTTVMRGFVNAVRKRLNIEDGKPVRTIEIVGENYGKIIRTSYIHYVQGLDPMAALASTAANIPLYDNAGIDLVSGIVRPSQVMAGIFYKFIYPQFQNIKRSILNRKATASNPNAMRENLGKVVTESFGNFYIDIDVDGVDGNRGYKIPINVVDPASGSTETPIYEFINSLSGKPWHETFVDDAPDATYFIYRPTPWRDRNGEFVGTTQFQQSFKHVYEGINNVVTVRDDKYTTVADLTLYPFPLKELDALDVIAYELDRSDDAVYNYFITVPAYTGLVDIETFLRNLMDNQDPHLTVDFNNILDKNGNKVDVTGLMKIPEQDKKDFRVEFSRMELFGFRKLMLNSKWLDVAEAQLSQDPELVTKLYYSEDAPFVRLAQALNKTLFFALEHNSQLESGVITIKGREDIRPGMYIKFRDERKDKDSHFYYVTDVSHTVQPFNGNFITRLVVARGEGHLAHTMGKESY
jgi:hypothetical protein